MSCSYLNDALALKLHAPKPRRHDSSQIATIQLGCRKLKTSKIAIIIRIHFQQAKCTLQLHAPNYILTTEETQQCNYNQKTLKITKIIRTHFPQANILR